LGTGTSIIAAIRHQRRGAGAETFPKYVQIAHQRINQELDGTLKTRPMQRPVYDPQESNNKLTVSPWQPEQKSEQMALMEKKSKIQKYHTP
jgi:adenine-specific DNA-methyltransferase